jgi:hypothetical protein
VRAPKPTLVILGAIASAACASGQLAPGFFQDDFSAIDGGSLVGFEAGASLDASPDATCPTVATLVYLLAEGSALYSYFPPTQTFTRIGALSCLSSPTHMTVDRQGTAFIVAGGRIYRASTQDASCSELTTWKPDAAFYDFSLTFIGTTNAIDDTLYLMNASVTLVTFDVMTGVRTPVAPAITLPSSPGDMTSNGDGTLYLLRGDAGANPTLYRLDPKTATVISQDTLTAQGQSNQALAFWGGSFYAFENDAVYQFDPMKKTTTLVATAPASVIGAGQSTCVPKYPPTK